VAVDRPLLSVVVPVFNGGPEIVDNVGEIGRAIAGPLGVEAIELVVVSDGSLDGTAERLLEARSDVEMRVIHYDRNLGKGYAVKVGSLAARGDWVALVDADLDLDPAAVPSFLETARRERLDFAIGSKRHPDSEVSYPRSRRVASWCYQQLNRVLFRLDVRDTQVGLKVFRREVAEQVMPLLLVKQFAFDLELLAVARALGFGRTRELPVRLDYRFTGSGVRSGAVARALWDTAAVFYRLRVLRTYQRKQRLIGATPTGGESPLVTLPADLPSGVELDYPRVEVSSTGEGELVGLLGPGVRPAGHWLSAAVPYFSRAEVAAVVTPLLAPSDATVRERAAAAVLESHLGGGSRRSTYLPGNVGYVDDYAGDCVVVRRGDRDAAESAAVEPDELVGWLAERGRRTVYTPDTIATVSPAPLYRPHLRATLAHGVSRGAAASRTGGGSLSGATALSVLPAGCAAAGAVLLAAPGTRPAGAVLLGGYGALVAGSAALAGVRFRSARVALHAAPGLVATQAAYVAGFAAGLAQSRSSPPRSGASSAGQSNRRT
jgi:glycosyltransferase involved in cell wall biosynthesis